MAKLKTGTNNVIEPVTSKKKFESTSKPQTEAAKVSASLTRIGAMLTAQGKQIRALRKDVYDMGVVLDSYRERDMQQRKAITGLYRTATPKARRSVEGLMQELGMRSDWGREPGAKR